MDRGVKTQKGADSFKEGGDNDFVFFRNLQKRIKKGRGGTNLDSAAGKAGPKSREIKRGEIPGEKESKRGRDRKEGKGNERGHIGAITKNSMDPFKN